MATISNAGDLADNEPSAFVSYAAGTVLLDLPSSWYASESVHGRSIRFVTSPQQPPEKVEALNDGLWIAVRYRDNPRRSLDAQQQLDALRQELATAQASGAIETFQVQGNTAFRQAFTVADGRRGFHQIVELPHATVQFGAIASAEGWQSRADVLREIVDTCALADPAVGTPPLAASLADAEAVVGVWKSPQSQIEWRADGRVVLRADGTRNYALSELGRLDYKKTIRTLQGTFSANDDLVEIVWDDGSRLNYRWKIVAGELYLTDHLGRVSLLWRLLK